MKCLQLLFLGYLRQAHCPIHFLVQRNNKQTAKRMAAKSVKLLTVTVMSNHPSSSSNSPPTLSLSLCVLTSLTPLSQPPSPHGRALSAQSVCSGLCMTMRECAFCDCESVGARGSYCKAERVLTWLQTNLDVSGTCTSSIGK